MGRLAPPASQRREVEDEACRTSLGCVSEGCHVVVSPHCGGWKVEGGRWRVEGGGWKVEGGRWKVEGAAAARGMAPPGLSSKLSSAAVRSLSGPQSSQWGWLGCEKTERGVIATSLWMVVEQGGCFGLRGDSEG